MSIEGIREHLVRVRAAGVGLDRIAALSGVSVSTIQRIFRAGVPGRQEQRIVRQRTAHALLSVSAHNATAHRRTLVPADTTHRAIRGLMQQGFRLEELARLLGRSATSLGRTLRGATVTRRTAGDVAELAETLSTNTQTRPPQVPGRRARPRRVGLRLRLASTADRYIYIMSIPERAARGSMKEAVGVHIKLAPEIYEQLAQAAADRGVSKRALLTAALVRELTDPSLDKPQDTLYDVAS